MLKSKYTKKAFTLIELLVVITIIWILATGAVSVYTSQIQKARDSTRITDIKAVQSWIEQFYQDKDQYPNSNNAGDYAFSWVTTYTPKLPQDPKSWSSRTNAAFDYIYTVGQDKNTIPGQDYEISATFEQDWNIEKKAKWDGWDDDTRIELWIDLDSNNSGNNTVVSAAITAASLECVSTWGSTITCGTEWTRLVIKK